MNKPNDQELIVDEKVLTALMKRLKDGITAESPQIAGIAVGDDDCDCDCDCQDCD